MDMDDTAAAAAVGVAGERQSGAAAADRASLSSPVTETLTFTTTTDASRVSHAHQPCVSMWTDCMRRIGGAKVRDGRRAASL